MSKVGDKRKLAGEKSNFAGMYHQYGEQKRPQSHTHEHHAEYSIRPLKRIRDHHPRSSSDISAVQHRRTSTIMSDGSAGRTQSVLQNMHMRPGNIRPQTLSPEHTTVPSPFRTVADVDDTHIGSIRTRLPTVLAEIIYRYAADSIVNVYGTRSRNIVLTQSRAAVLLDTMVVIQGVKKVCVNHDVCCILQYNGKAHFIGDDMQDEHVVRGETVAIQDISQVGKHIIMLTHDGAVESYRQGVITKYTLTSTITRLQETEPLRHNHDTFIAISSDATGTYEIVHAIEAEYGYNESQTVHADGVVRAVYRGGSRWNPTFVVVNTMGGVVPLMERDHKVKYSEVKDQLQSEVVDIYMNHTGVVARKRTGDIVMWGDIEVVDITTRLSKIVSTPYYWVGLTVDDNIVCWGRDGISSLSTLFNDGLGDGPEKGVFVKGDVQDIYTTSDVVVVVSKSGGFVRLYGGWSLGRMHVLPVESSLTRTFETSSTHIDVNDYVHFTMTRTRNDKKAGITSMLGFRGNGELLSTITKAGNIRHIYSADSDHVILFDDGTVKTLDYAAHRTGFADTLVDIVDIYTIADCRFAAVTNTGRIAIWGQQVTGYVVEPVYDMF